MDPISIVVLVLLLCVSAFFSGAESAYLSINLLKFQTFAKESVLAQRVLKLRENTERLIIVMLIGTNLANIAATAMVTSIISDTFESNAIGIATGFMTFIILIFGEILPKNLAITHATRIALFTAPVFQFLVFVLKPIILFFELLTGAVIKILGGGEQMHQYSEDDLKTLVEVGVLEKQVEQEDQKRIEGILNLDNLEAHDVMTPRLKMYAIFGESTYGEVHKEILASGHSRIPIMGRDKDEIIGILYLRDFLTSYIEKGDSGIVCDIAEDPLFIGEYETIGDIFQIFKQKRKHLAIVQDEYGGTAGLITLEDIIEEITGDIFDETDAREQKNIRKVTPSCYIVSGDTEIDELNNLLQVQIDREDDFNTIGGYLQSQSEKVIDETGHTEIIDGLKFEVLEMHHSKLSKIKIQKLD